MHFKLQETQKIKKKKKKRGIQSKKLEMRQTRKQARDSNNHNKIAKAKGGIGHKQS